MLPDKPHSLSKRLLWLLLGAVVLVACAEFYVSYRSALSEADDIFDYHMQQIAIALRPGLSVTPQGHSRERKKGEDNGDFLIQIWTADGLQVFEPDDSLALPQLAVFGFSNVKARGTTFRVFSVQTATQIIQIAQDLAVRREIAGKLALRTAAPILLMAPILMLLVLWVVNRSFRPLARVRREVSERQVSGLSPVNEAGLPEEIQPLVRELNHLLERVKEAFETQQHFVADAAHELRSPLTALKLQVQGLRRAADNETRELAVARLSSGIDRATHLVEQLLILARQQASTATGTNPEHVSLSAVCRLAFEDTLAAAKEGSIDMGISHADDVEIEGYPDALRILVRNLLDNAIKYSPAGGRIDLEIRTVDGAVELTVDDSGPGIDVEHRERVLDRFYRINDAQKMGSGLGLAIVKSIADRHRAALSLAHSARLGGLRVIARFPRLGHP
ncbi:ATP-binding protein [Propionivibrio sp.]|uniref:ATP-binding protein n=1 Tax=Propionivibrio sp. TaxID=2212460 RepID=UPI0025F8CDA7|nr:ATP-binding protein [Propionivibrio sp.]MBK7355400.1 sensor histidine kinase N-terminal domain-containing protein [Propionivibrio sp.]MBK8399794.1 sensor histidine kinase N-terminal domain-containing protein [Propionivibrio sp.]MBK8743308.1 sensor histidine kinase N-terminal domain-containing protein [Propionivibrio sp.]MBK8894668.1 sensor histidine kinase N-terminal domain-containing protein [Propionivibrio sp.]MBL0207150.1 sensor histidine kinase N-terminal domain-containing protein [Prop